MKQQSLFDPPDSHQMTPKPSQQPQEPRQAIIAPSGQAEPHSDLDAERRRDFAESLAYLFSWGHAS